MADWKAIYDRAEDNFLKMLKELSEELEQEKAQANGQTQQTSSQDGEKQ